MAQPFVHGSVLGKADCFKKNLYSHDAIHSEDYELWLRLSTEYTIYYSNAISSSIINHFERSVLIMNKDNLIIRFKTLVDCVIQNQNFILKYGKYKNYFLANNYSYIALHISLTGKNKLDTIKYLCKALIKSPNIVLSKRFYAIIKHLIISN